MISQLLIPLRDVLSLWWLIEININTMADRRWLLSFDIRTVLHTLERPRTLVWVTEAKYTRKGAWLLTWSVTGHSPILWWEKMLNFKINCNCKINCQIIYFFILSVSVCLSLLCGACTWLILYTLHSLSILLSNIYILLMNVLNEWVKAIWLEEYKKGQGRKIMVNIQFVEQQWHISFSIFLNL